MFFDILEIPKVVNKDDFALNKIEYSVTNTTEKHHEHVLLFKKDLLDEKTHYYNIFDLSEKIKKDYPNFLYLIIEKDKVNNFRVIIGNTIDISNSSYYAKHKVLATEIIENKSKISDLIKISTQMLNIEKIVVFHVGITKEDVEMILTQENSNFSYTFDKNIEKYFYFLSAREKPLSKAMPIILSIVSILFLSSISSFVADTISKKNKAKQAQEIELINIRTNEQTKTISKLSEQNAELEKFSRKNLQLFFKEGK